ncbi:MAG: NADPH-dependent glutamate synthase [Planctomycetota bacterium]|jgi:glutamate synthase (NADPH/NADH) small chain
MDEQKKKPKPKKPKIPRTPMPEQDPNERRRNFSEVPFGYTPEMAKLEASRCTQCKKPKCIQGCPVDVKIPEFIKLIAEGKFIESAWKLKETNALPAVCGRVCPQETQCEEICILGKKQEPVAIGRLERFAADYERNQGKVQIPEIASSTGKRVAIVGCGPAGLTCAGDLIKLGHDVHIFEALHAPGGVLVYGIPEFRLPKAIVYAEVDYLKSCGVSLHLNAIIGKMHTVLELIEELEFDTVFIGTGAGAPAFMRIPGENLTNIYSANEWLTRTNLMRAYQFPEADTPIHKGRIVCTIGGGNVAMDSARTALRLGADRSIVVYRRTRKEMPARDEEIHHAEQEGVEFHFLTAPVKYEPDDEGKVKEMRCIQMELGEPDASGRRRPVPIDNSEFGIPCDTVVVAIGNLANPIVPDTTPGLELNKWGNIEADAETGATSIPGVYAGGDIVTGAATVIEAMGAGKKAARAMHAYLTQAQAPAAK